MLARVVKMATFVVVALLVAGILLHVLDANMSNQIVSAVNDAAKWLAQPFDNIFSPSGSKERIAANWGLAALVYLVIGMLISRLLVRAGAGGGMKRSWRRRGAAA
jgi:Trk-type K+ transport system membrane component